MAHTDQTSKRQDVEMRIEPATSAGHDAVQPAPESGTADGDTPEQFHPVTDLIGRHLRAHRQDPGTEIDLML